MGSPSSPARSRPSRSSGCCAAGWGSCSRATRCSRTSAPSTTWRWRSSTSSAARRRRRGSRRSGCSTRSRWAAARRRFPPSSRAARRSAWRSPARSPSTPPCSSSTNPRRPSTPRAATRWRARCGASRRTAAAAASSSPPTTRRSRAPAPTAWRSSPTGRWSKRARPPGCSGGRAIRRRVRCSRFPPRPPRARIRLPVHRPPPAARDPTREEEHRVTRRSFSLAAVWAAAAAAAAPVPDRRVGLRAGWFDAGTALWNLRLVSTTPPSAQFIDRSKPGEVRFINSDLAFTGHYAIQGNYSGFQIWDIADPRHPRLVTGYVCPGAQNDVSVYGHLLFVSAEALDGRVDCGTQGVPDSVSAERMRGIRIFDIGDIAHPRLVANVQTCRGSHTHTVVPDPRDSTVVYIYVSGTAPVRSPNELAGCSGAPPDVDPNSALFRIEVIRVPLAHPEDARIVSSPRIFANLGPPPAHGPAPEDSIAAARAAAEARARGAFTATIFGMEYVLPERFVAAQLDSVVRARGGAGGAGGAGAATAADSAALRAALPDIIGRILGTRTGPTQCHDITVYPAIGRAGGACAGYGLLLDIRDPVNPVRIAAVADSNFAFWHSATFNNDGTKLLFTDEWGGGSQPRCRATDRREWGADAIFTLSGDTLAFRSYYKLPAPQTPYENCVAHNGSLIPVPGRDIMVQAWYQGGVSVFDWTDPDHPREIAYFDRGPMDSTKLVDGGSWSAYWYNGYIVSSEISRGLDILELVPSPWLTADELAAAKLVRFATLNVQDQPRFAWPADPVVARAYLDQLERSGGLAPERIAAARAALARAARLTGTTRRDALLALATELEQDAGAAADPAKVRLVAATVREMAGP